MKTTLVFLAGTVLAGLSYGSSPTMNDDVVPPTEDGWYHWRGPDQNGSSAETGLIDTIELNGTNHAWTYDLPGRGTPVMVGHRLYAMGYEVTGGLPEGVAEAAEASGVEVEGGPNLQELLICLDARTGKLIWEHRFSDYLNDSIYNRYALGSPTIDPQTGHVYCQTSPGLLNCFSADGQLIWQHSMMELNGRLTFPNGRIGAPIIEGDLCIVHGITANWGRDQGPARDRFFAFEKSTGHVAWVCTPGVGPKDSSWSTPVIETRNGKRVIYAGTGCGHIVCINALNGAPLWRFRMSIGGVNCSPVLHNDHLIAIHGKENLDTSETGRMVAIKLGAEPGEGEEGPKVLDYDSEAWRNHLHIFTSSPVLANNRVYQTIHTGELCSVNADTGEIYWEKKYGTEQIHASPLFADGKLYVPMNDGGFHIVEPSDEGPKDLCRIQLAGACLAAPAVFDGRLFVHTTKKLYCFADTSKPLAMSDGPKATALQAIPMDFVASPGDILPLRVRSLDANGYVVDQDVRDLEFASKSPLKIGLTNQGAIEVTPGSGYGATYIKAMSNGLETTIRARIVPNGAYQENFNDIELNKPHYAEEGVMMALPPSHWLASSVKWEVRDLDGERVLAKRLDNTLFQRSSVMIGHPDMSNYTAQIDIMTDGNRRFMNTAGLIHQRYLISIKGNAQLMEISSNHERIKVSEKFRWKPKKWYTLKTQVINPGDGSAIIRGKAWLRGEEEPEGWNIEYTHEYGHHNGSFGLFGYTQQSRYRVYMDNLVVTPND